MPAHHYPFIELAVHAAVRDHFAKGDAVAAVSYTHLTLPTIYSV